MRLKLEELKRVVDQTVSEERFINELRKEITRVLGPSVVTNVKLDQLAEGANYRIDVLERTGRANDIKFNVSILSKFMNSNSIEARKLAARLLPENFAAKFKEDKNVSVRHAYARRTSIKNAIQMLRENPRDHELRYIISEKRIAESGIPQPKAINEPFDMHGKKLGNSVKQQDSSDLSDLWYSSMAHKFIQDYGSNLEGNWEEIIAKRYCASVKANTTVDVDEEKLYKEIVKQLQNKDKRVAEKYSVKETKLNNFHGDPYDKNSMIVNLLESDYSSSEYVNKANKIFSIAEMSVPPSLSKFRMSEGKKGHFSVPCKGMIPGDGKITSLIEEALDAYVKNWNNVQAFRGEPIKIHWLPNPVKNGAITFKAELKL